MNKAEFTRVQSLTKEDLADPEIFDYVIRRIHTQGEIQHVLKNASIEFLTPVIEDLIEQENVSIDDIPKVFLEDYNIAYFYVKEDYVNMVMLPDKFRDNEEFIYNVISSDGRVLDYATDRVKDMEYIVNAALKNTPKAFKYIPEKYKTKENCLIALTGAYPDYADNWKYVPEHLALNEDFIKEAGVISPKIYQYLNKDIKDKYEITEYFLRKYAGNISHLSEDNKNNIDLVGHIIEKEPVYLKYAGDKLKNDPEFILPIIKKVPYEIHDCGDAIKSNKKVAQYICNVKTHRPPIEFFNEEVKADFDIAMTSVLCVPESMNYISKTLSSNVDFLLEYVEKPNFSSTALHYIPNELKNNLEIMTKAYDRDAGSIEYVGNTLRHNEKFLSHIFSPMEEKGKVPKHKLLANLNCLHIKTGDEDILLNFCNSSNLDINETYTKADILRQIRDQKFVSLLNSQSNLYEYLKSASLMKNLKEELSEEPEEVKVKKIKI